MLACLYDMQLKHRIIFLLSSHYDAVLLISGGQSTQIKYLSKSTDTYNQILLQ